MSEEKILADIEEADPSQFYYLNIFNLPGETEEKEILLFYKDIPLRNIHRHSRDAADLEFEKKEHLIAAIDKGSGVFGGQTFYIRTSYFLNRARRGGKPRGGRGGRYGGHQYNLLTQ